RCEENIEHLIGLAFDFDQDFFLEFVRSDKWHRRFLNSHKKAHKVQNLCLMCLFVTIALQLYFFVVPFFAVPLSVGSTFFAPPAVFCLAMIWSEILSYVA